MKNPVEILIENLEKNCTIKVGTISTAADGTQYRYDSYILKYQNTAYWLRLMFEKASLFVTKNEYNKQFSYGDYSFYFDRSTFKNEKDRKITMNKLIILS
jgi:hypothetical protein